jgi:protein gp37
MHPDWARSLRDQCAAAGVAFLFKQWGEWGPCDHLGEELDGMAFGCFGDAGQWLHPVDQQWANAGRTMMFRAGKARAGRTLDGVTHDGFPGVSA